MEVWLFLAALLLVPLALITRTSFVFLKQVRQAPPWRLALGSFLHLQPSLLRPPPSPALSSTDNVSFPESHPHHSCSPSTCSAFFLSIEFISISGHIQIIFFKCRIRNSRVCINEVLWSSRTEHGFLRLVNSIRGEPHVRG